MNKCEKNAYKYMVCTRCMTYNHEAYIKDAMDGFVMQQTEWPVVYVIVDDASTDGTVEVIKSYINEHFCTEKALRLADTSNDSSFGTQKYNLVA